MCGDVTIPDPSSITGEHTIYSLGQLRHYFTVLPEDVYPRAEDSDCLCCVHVAAVLKRTGDEWWEGCCSDWRLRSMIDNPDDGWWVKRVIPTNEWYLIVYPDGLDCSYQGSLAACVDSHLFYLEFTTDHATPVAVLKVTVERAASGATVTSEVIPWADVVSASMGEREAGAA